MGEAFIVRRGGVVSETTAAPTITIISEDPSGVTFTLTNNDDNTAIVTYEIDDEYGAVELAAAATSSNITVELDPDTYTLTAYATVVGEVASTSDAAVEIVAIPSFELLFDSLTADDGDPITLPATQLDITGLSIGKNDELLCVMTIVSNDNHGLSVFANNNTTPSNYTLQDFGGNGTTIGGERRNFAWISFLANGKTQIMTNIKVSNNDRYVLQSSNSRLIGSNSSSITQGHHNVVSTGFTLTNITSLQINSTGTNSILAGSRIRLYKVNTGDA
jgi:hypothetical protein